MSDDVRNVNPLEALREDAEQGGHDLTGEPLPTRERPPTAPPQALSVEPEGSENDQQPEERPQEITTEQPENSQEPEQESETSPVTTLEEDIALLTGTESSKKWVIGPEAMQREYLQRELSVVGKVQWFALVGDILEKALSGNKAISLNSLLSPPEIKPGQPVMQQFVDADTFVHAAGKLLVYSPDFLQESVCIWLGVPDYERDLVKDMLAMSPTDGGLSDDDFETMFNHFIDQNYMSIERFFRVRFPRLQKRLQVRRREADGQSLFQRR